MWTLVASLRWGEAGNAEHGRGVLNCPDAGDPALPIGGLLDEQKGKEQFGLVPFTRLCVEEEN